MGAKKLDLETVENREKKQPKKKKIRFRAERKKEPLWKISLSP